MLLSLIRAMVASFDRLPRPSLAESHQPVCARICSQRNPFRARPDAGKPWLLGADDTVTEIRDEHVAEIDQRDFDELVEGLGPSRTLAWDAYDPQAAVDKHAAWTAAIRAATG